MDAPPAPLVSRPKLLDRVRWHLRPKHYSLRTEDAYLDWIRHFILFHHKRHPDEMGEKEIGAFLTNWRSKSRALLLLETKPLAPFFFFTGKSSLGNGTFSITSSG